jgi:hypothetical protein
MNVIFESFGPGDTIPTLEYLKNRKLKKYFNRETEACIVGMGKLVQGIELDPEIPC